MRWFVVAIAVLISVFHAQSVRAITQSGPLTRIGVTTHVDHELPHDFSVLVWNTHKGADGSAFFNDLTSLAQSSDLVLLQEALDEKLYLSGLLSVRKDFGWTLAKAFYSQRESGHTGVATGAAVFPQIEKTVLSKVTEPVAGTPKSILISEFRIKNSNQTLMVVNVHMINFVVQDSFEQHVKQIIDQVRGHQGPLMIAGDFNTWSGGRMSYLKFQFRQKLGLVAVSMLKQGLLDLDHIFVRQLEVAQALQLGFIKSSDHAPLVARFRLMKPPVID